MLQDMDIDIHFEANLLAKKWIIDLHIDYLSDVGVSNWLPTLGLGSLWSSK